MHTRITKPAEIKRFRKTALEILQNKISRLSIPTTQKEQEQIENERITLNCATVYIQAIAALEQISFTLDNIFMKIHESKRKSSCLEADLITAIHGDKDPYSLLVLVNKILYQNCVSQNNSTYFAICPTRDKWKKCSRYHITERRYTRAKTHS